MIKKINCYDAPLAFYINDGYMFSWFKSFDPYLKRRDLRIAAQKKIYSYFSLLTFHLFVRTVFNGRLYYSNRCNCFIIITCEEEDYKHLGEDMYPRTIREEDMANTISHVLSKVYNPYISFIFTRFVCYRLKEN